VEKQRLINVLVYGDVRLPGVRLIHIHLFGFAPVI